MLPLSSHDSLISAVKRWFSRALFDSGALATIIAAVMDAQHGTHQPPAWGSGCRG